MDKDFVLLLTGAGIALVASIATAILQHFLSLRADIVRRNRDTEERLLREERERVHEIDDQMRGLLLEMYDLDGQMQIVKEALETESDKDKHGDFLDQLRDLEKVKNGIGERFELLEQLSQEHQIDLENLEARLSKKGKS